MSSLLAVLLPLLLPVLPIQDQAKATAPEQIFYRAFYFDRGQRDLGRALQLYREFLGAAPEHPLAADAARYVLNLLTQAKRDDEAKVFSQEHVALLAKSAKAGINAQFLDPDLAVESFVGRFEGESREIARLRNEIIDIVGAKSDQAIADVGAGTGLFTWPFARAVGKQGRVYAVEISPRFLEHLERSKKRGSFDQVIVHAGGERAVGLPEASIDKAFICDTYHHFEYPLETMKSVHEALRPGGELVIVDFERIPGKSREWTLGHVRAGKEVVIKEIESCGFSLVREEKTRLTENYCVRFRKS